MVLSLTASHNIEIDGSVPDHILESEISMLLEAVNDKTIAAYRKGWSDGRKGGDSK